MQASGSYAAVHLQRRGYAVKLFERAGELGGNCETVRVASPHANDDGTRRVDNVTAAVMLFTNASEIAATFAEFGMRTRPRVRTELVRDGVKLLADSATGAAVVAPPCGAACRGAERAALDAWTALLERVVDADTGRPVVYDPDGYHDISKCTEEDRAFLMTPLGTIVEQHPVLAPLLPKITLLLMGLGNAFDVPLLHAARYAFPAFLDFDTLLSLDDSCQPLYDAMHDELARNGKNDAVVHLNTEIAAIRRREDDESTGVDLEVVASNQEGCVEDPRDDGVCGASQTRRTYACADVILAVRPNDLDASVLADASADEKRAFFDDGALAYNGLTASVWRMTPGPRLRRVLLDAGAADKPFELANVRLDDDTLAMLRAQTTKPTGLLRSLRLPDVLVEAGVTYFFKTLDALGLVGAVLGTLPVPTLRDPPGVAAVIKHSAVPDYPYAVFYHTSEPPRDQEAHEAAIRRDLEALGFEDVSSVFVKPHTFAVTPPRDDPDATAAFYSVVQRANDDDDHLFFTGSTLAGDGTEHVWAHARRLLDRKFPPLRVEGH